MLNDYDANDDEYYEEGYESDGLRWMSLLVVLLVVVGFFTLAWYVYKTGMEQNSGGEVLIVEADDSPYRELPEDAGGMEFPGSDKTVYETIASDDGRLNKLTNKLQNETEEPIVERILESDNAKVIIIDKDKAEAKIEKKEVKVTTQTPVVAPAITKKSNVTFKSEDPIVAESEKYEATDKVVKPIEKVNDFMGAKKAVAKPSVKTSGKYQVQIAALRSYNAAESMWKKLSKTHYSIIGGHGHKIIKAVVKGVTYYRLRVVGFTSKSSASGVCKKLKARGQGCMVL